MHRYTAISLFVLFTVALPGSPTLIAAAEGAEFKMILAAVRSVGPEGQGNRVATAAWRELVDAGKAEELPEILAAMDGANPLAANWLRAAVDAIAERTLKQQQNLPTAALENFLKDTRHDPRARRLAFEWLAQVDNTAADRIIPLMLNDESVEFRRDAVTRLLDEAAPLFDKGDSKAKEIYKKALSGARDEDQIKLIAERLRKLGETVDITRHFGFLTNWHLVGPFDNREKKGFPVAYPPETTVNLEAKYDGKEGAVNWIAHTTEDEYGKVDLNKALGKNMGAVAYCYTTFIAEAERDVEIRLACTNANKLWLNGKEVAAFEVYHAGNSIDQYRIKGRLTQGRNVILLKVCQNEQTEPWAQEWSFQVRVCDQTGTAILSQDRVATK